MGTGSTTAEQRAASDNSESTDALEIITIVGSTATSDFSPRLFRIDIPKLPLFFSGTGDMFAALIVSRFSEAVKLASPDLASTPSWQSSDDIAAEDLPLAKACQKVLASMQAILAKTTERCHEKMEVYDKKAEKEGRGAGREGEEDAKRKRHLALMNASEVVVPRHVSDLVEPPELEQFRPRALVE